MGDDDRGDDSGDHSAGGDNVHNYDDGNGGLTMMLKWRGDGAGKVEVIVIRWVTGIEEGVEVRVMAAVEVITKVGDGGGGSMKRWWSW